MRMRRGSLSKSKAKERLQKLLDAISTLQGLNSDSSEFSKWRRNVEVAIEKAFGADSRHLNDFTAVKYSGIVFPGMPEDMIQEAYIKGLDRASSVLGSMIEEIDEYWEESPAALTDAGSPSRDRRQIFVIHGHDEGSKEAVARLLERLGLDPIILHEQPSQGQTVIEKFERHASVGFAIALMTPDDVGKKAAGGAKLKPRARQNVVLELGYFIGSLGRTNVCALVKGNVEIPSDLFGMVYTKLDDEGSWKTSLARELKACGFDVDMNLIA